MKHTEYKCKQPCTTLHCNYCEGGLFFCTVCKCAEGTLASECPGEKVDSDKEELIYDGKLDYRGGKWVEKPSGSCYSHYDGRPGLPD
jgi:hypothetical protein